jgi:hypothetical protein
MIGKTMTAPRRLSRRNLLAALTTLGALASTRGGYAATTEQIVVDGRTGLAISGFDPVAYFVEGAAKPGRDVFEHVFAGVTWRFCNEGNQAAFAADPEVYMPRFGGYDPVGIARGVTAPVTPGSGRSSRAGSISSIPRKTVRPSPPIPRTSSPPPSANGRPCNAPCRLELRSGG